MSGCGVAGFWAFGQTVVGRPAAPVIWSQMAKRSRYMGLDLLAKVLLHPIESETDDTVLPTELTA